MGLVLDYGSLLNHHESPNVKPGEEFPGSTYIHFQVSMVFNIFIAILQKFAVCMHTYTTETRTHHTLFKATKDIAAGQEILVRYGDASWFESKKIPYADVDYASTRWRPDLHPLPCRQRVRPTTGADGRHSFAVLVDTIPSGTVVEISICVEVSVIVVDQFPILWDFVVMDATTQQVCARTRMQPVY